MSLAVRTPFAARPPRLPLWQRVLFVDFNGVLNHDPFWSSILTAKAHKMRVPVQSFVRRVFSDEAFVRDWMRGVHSAEDAISRFDAPAMPEAKEGFMLKRLIQDCVAMSLDGEIVQVLQKIRQHSIVVLATDNMDCFVNAIDENREIRNSFDYVLCSCEIGVLKEEPEHFFAPWLKRHGLSFRDAVLVDDSAQNCRAFEEAGGSAIRFAQRDSALVSLARRFGSP